MSLAFFLGSVMWQVFFSIRLCQIEFQRCLFCRAIRPIFLKHQPQIDNLVNKATAQVGGNHPNQQFYTVLQCLRPDCLRTWEGKNDPQKKDQVKICWMYSIKGRTLLLYGSLEDLHGGLGIKNNAVFLIKEVSVFFFLSVKFVNFFI